MNIGECMEYAQKLCDAKSSSERIEARKELRAAIAATVKAETDHLARELAEAKARALPDGWVAVPVEATAEMATAAVNEADRQENKWLYDGKAFWSAMLSARPESPPNGLPSKEFPACGKKAPNRESQKSVYKEYLKDQAKKDMEPFYKVLGRTPKESENE